MKSRSMPIALVATMLSLLPAARAAELDGTWLTEDGSTRVAFNACGARICGRIVWLREPVDAETGQPWQDKHNRVEASRSRALVGLPILTEMVAAGPSQWRGTLYNPLDGRSYAGKINDLGGGKLELSGCALAGLICQKEIWTRSDKP